MAGYLNHAGLMVLKAILGRLREAADDLRRRERNQGAATRGRPPDELRRQVLLGLRHLYEVTTGRRPGRGGPFVELCDAVFVGFGWPTDGLERAVRTLMRERKKPSENG